jgi:hypothetical protein
MILRLIVHLCDFCSHLTVSSNAIRRANWQPFLVVDVEPVRAQRFDPALDVVLDHRGPGEIALAAIISNNDEPM